MQKLWTRRARGHLYLGSGELVEHDLWCLHRLGSGRAMNFARDDQFWPVENRCRRKQLCFHHRPYLDRRGLRSQRGKRNQFGDAILLQLQPVRKYSSQVNQEQKQQHHEGVAGAERTLVDLAFRQYSELKVLLRHSSHVVTPRGSRPRKRTGIGVFTLREKGQGVNVSTALDQK